MALLEALKALSDDSRARLAHVLSKGQFNVQELTKILSTSQSTVSHHLKVLQTAKVAKVRRDGTWSYYSLENGSDPTTPGNFARDIINKIAGGSEDEFRNVLASDLELIAEVLKQRQERTRQYFDSVAPKWREMRTRTHGNDSILAELLRRLPIDGVLLELGCGSGALLEKLLPRKGQTLGVDSSPAMLDEARRALGERSALTDLRLGHLEHLPFANNAVDCACSSLVFHLVSEPVEALRDTLRVLKPGGKLIVLERSPVDETHAREQFGELWRSFTKEEFARTVKSAGFEKISMAAVGLTEEFFLLEAHKPIT